MAQQKTNEPDLLQFRSVRHVVLGSPADCSQSVDAPLAAQMAYNTGGGVLPYVTRILVRGSVVQLGLAQEKGDPPTGLIQFSGAYFAVEA